MQPVEQTNHKGIKLDILSGNHTALVRLINSMTLQPLYHAEFAFFIYRNSLWMQGWINQLSMQSRYDI